MTVFTKLVYDHNKIQFNKISLLTRHALALTTTGELYAFETDKYKGKFDSIIQIGYNKDEADDNACIHRGVSK